MDKNSKRTVIKELQDAVKNMTLSGMSIQEKSYGGGIPPKDNDMNPPGVVNMDVVMVDNKTEPQPGSSTHNLPDSNTGCNTRVIFMLGMAGSGKTTFTQRLAAHLFAQKKTVYILNFDPACEDPPFPVNIDIRDTVDFKKVMQQYTLGPNGGIVTSLNLFTTLFDKVLDIVKVRAKTHEYILVDTPGQLECFLWSASGQIMLDSFAALFPTIITYVTDVIVCQNPITFASNMMYGVTILFKSKLPMILALNKADLDPTIGKTIASWITDFEVVEATLNRMEGYSVTLSSSITLSLEEFYKIIQHCIVSAADGYGFKEYEKAVDKAVVEYMSTYRVMYEEMIATYEKNLAKRKENDLIKFRQDFEKTVNDQVFSMQATTTLAQGIDIFPHDSDDDETSDSDEDEFDDDNLGEFKPKETVKRETKRTITLANPSGSQI